MYTFIDIDKKKKIWTNPSRYHQRQILDKPNQRELRDSAPVQRNNEWFVINDNK